MQDPEMVDTNAYTLKQPGRYHRDRQLKAANGLGTVWLGTDPDLRRQVVLKALPPRSASEQIARLARFEREVEAIAALNHPHILPIHDRGAEHVGEDICINYFVMPYIEGGSLADLLMQENQAQLKPTTIESLTLLKQAASALDYAHARGVLHLNLKPTNLLLRSRNWLLLADFGIVGTQTIGKNPHVSAMKSASSPYIAPEQARGNPSAASDIYSLAVIACLLLTEQPDIDTQRQMQIPSSLPPACQEVLRRGMEEEPGKRYSSASDFVDALQKSLSQMMPEDSRTKLTRRTFLIGSGLAGIGLGIWAFASHMQATSPPQTQKFDPDLPLLILQEHHHPAQTLAWAPNKLTLISASNPDAQIKQWDLARLQPQQASRFASSLTSVWQGSELVLAWSPDGSIVAVASKEKADADQTSHLRLLDASLNSSNLAPGQEIQVPTSKVAGLVWQRQRYIVAAWNDSSSNNMAAYLGMWDSQQPGKALRPARLPQRLTDTGALDAQSVLASTSDGTRLALCTINGALIGNAEVAGNAIIWQPAPPGLLQPHPGSNQNEPQALAWSESNQRLSLIGLFKNGENTTLNGWGLYQNPAIPFTLEPLSASTRFTTIAIHLLKDQQTLAAGSESGEVYLWNNSTNLPSRTLKSAGIQGKVLALAWSFDGQWLAASYNDPKASILIWKLE